MAPISAELRPELCRYPFYNQHPAGGLHLSPCTYSLIFHFPFSLSPFSSVCVVPLNLSDVEEEEQGNDWLYTVIADIILAHNSFVEGPRLVPSQPFRRLLPDDQATAFAYPQEITTANCIVPQFEKYVCANECIDAWVKYMYHTFTYVTMYSVYMHIHLCLRAWVIHM